MPSPSTPPRTSSARRRSSPSSGTARSPRGRPGRCRCITSRSSSSRCDARGGKRKRKRGRPRPFARRRRNRRRGAARRRRSRSRLESAARVVSRAPSKSSARSRRAARSAAAAPPPQTPQTPQTPRPRSGALPSPLDPRDRSRGAPTPLSARRRRRSRRSGFAPDAPASLPGSSPPAARGGAARDDPRGGRDALAPRVRRRERLLLPARRVSVRDQDGARTRRGRPRDPPRFASGAARARRLGRRGHFSRSREPRVPAAALARRRARRRFRGERGVARRERQRTPRVRLRARGNLGGLPRGSRRDRPGVGEQRGRRRRGRRGGPRGGRDGARRVPPGRSSTPPSGWASRSRARRGEETPSRSPCRTRACWTRSGSPSAWGRSRARARRRGSRCRGGGRGKRTGGRSSARTPRSWRSKASNTRGEEDESGGDDRLF